MGRLGNNSNEMSSWGADTLKAWRAGTTERQRNAERRRRQVMAGVQAGLTGAQGIAGYIEQSNKEDEARKKDYADREAIMRRAIENSKKAAGMGQPQQPQDGGQQSYAKYVQDAYQKAENPYEVTSQDAAKNALDRQDTNMAQEPVRDTWGTGGDIYPETGVKDTWGTGPDISTEGYASGGGLMDSKNPYGGDEEDYNLRIKNGEEEY